MITEKDMARVSKQTTIFIFPTCCLSIRMIFLHHTVSSVIWNLIPMMICSFMSGVTSFLRETRRDQIIARTVRWTHGLATPTTTTLSRWSRQFIAWCVLWESSDHTCTRILNMPIETTISGIYTPKRKGWWWWVIVLEKINSFQRFWNHAHVFLDFIETFQDSGLRLDNWILS